MDLVAAKMTFSVSSIAFIQMNKWILMLVLEITSAVHLVFYALYFVFWSHSLQTDCILYSDIVLCHDLAFVVPVLVLLFVNLYFILRGDLLYVFPCVILFLCFSVLLVLRLPRLGKRELILVLFVRLFGLCLFRFVGFRFLLGSGKGFVL